MLSTWQLVMTRGIAELHPSPESRNEKRLRDDENKGFYNMKLKQTKNNRACPDTPTNRTTWFHVILLKYVLRAQSKHLREDLYERIELLRSRCRKVICLDYLDSYASSSGQQLNSLVKYKMYWVIKLTALNNINKNKQFCRRRHEVCNIVLSTQQTEFYYENSDLPIINSTKETPR